MGLQWLRLQKRFISSCLKTQHGDEERDGKKSRRGTCCCVIACNFRLKLRHRESSKKQSSAAESNRSANSGSGLRSYSRDPYPYGRDNRYAPSENWPDPYAPGVNWPGKW